MPTGERRHELHIAGRFGDIQDRLVGRYTKVFIDGVEAKWCIEALPGRNGYAVVEVPHSTYPKNPALCPTCHRAPLLAIERGTVQVTIDAPPDLVPYLWKSRDG